MMIGMTIDVVENSAWALRTAAPGALVFDVFYVVHRLLQGLGPDDATPAGMSAFNLAHRVRRFEDRFTYRLRVGLFDGCVDARFESLGGTVLCGEDISKRPGQQMKSIPSSDGKEGGLRECRGIWCS
jgi:hypothetical protein